MAELADGLSRQLNSLEETDKKEKCEDDLEGLEEVDLSSTRYTFAQDFCVRVASIFADEYTSVEQIKQLLIIMAKTKKKKELLSSTFRVFAEVYKNYLLKSQIKLAFEAYKQEASNFGAGNKDDIEARCIKVFTKISALNIKESTSKEFNLIFHKLEPAIVLQLARRFIHGKFIKAIEDSASLIRGNPELLCDPEDDRQTKNVLGLAQYILENIQSIRNALKQFMEDQGFALVSVKKITLQNRSLVVDPNEIDPFFREYLLEILQVELPSAHQNEQPTEDMTASPTKDQKHEKRSKTHPGLDDGTKSAVGSWMAEHVSIPHLMSSIRNINNRSIPSEAPPLPREAMSIVAHLDVEATDSPRLSQRSGDTSEKMLIISSRFHKSHCCSCRKSDEIAAMLDRFPLVEAVNDAGAIRASIIKYLRLYPSSIQTVGPYLILIEGAAALIGALTATDGILNPKKTRLHFRIWKATTNGIVLFIFSLGASINIYLAMHPDKKNIPEETFYEEMDSVPFFLMLSHIVWNSISPMQKERWFPRETCYYSIRKSIDVVSRSLYNAGVFLFEGITFFTLPKEMLYQLLPLIPGTLVAFGQTFTPYKEQLTTGMTYITFSVFSTMLFKDELPNSPDRAFEGWPHVIGRCAYLSTLTLYSFYLLIKNYFKFVEEYVNEEDEAEILVRRIHVPVVNGVLDLSNFRGQGTVINTDEYHRLADDVEQGRVDEAHRKTLIFSNRLTLPQPKPVLTQEGGHAPILSKRLEQDEQDQPDEQTPRLSMCDRIAQCFKCFK